MKGIQWEEEYSLPYKHECPTDDFRMANNLGQTWCSPEHSILVYNNFVPKKSSLPGLLPCSRELSDQTPQNLAVAEPETVKAYNFQVQYSIPSPFLQFSPTMSPRGSTETARPYQDQDPFLLDPPQSQSLTSTPTSDDSSPFLLDDDPFADLTCSAVTSTPSSTGRDSLFISRPSTPQPNDLTTATLLVPRSPLSPPDSSTSCYFGTAPATPPRARSLGKIKPAYARPAFASRPSLPSLDTLARMNIVPPRKVRRGKVGAHLPFEPWENQQDADESGMSGNELDTPCITRPASPSTILAQFQAQYLAGSVTESSAGDIEFDGPTYSFTLASNPNPTTQFTSDADSFSFFDNLSTPSLERSSASLSRSLSIESMSPSEPVLGDNRNYDSFGNSISDLPPDGYSDTPTVPLLPPFGSHPTLSRKGSFTGHSDKFPHADDAAQFLDPLPSATDLVLQDILVEPCPESTLDSLGEEESMSGGSSAPSSGYTGNPRFGPSGAVRYGNGNGGRSGFNGHSRKGNGGNQSGGGGRDEGSDDERHGRSAHRPALSGSSTSATSSEEEDSEEDYGEPIAEHRSKSTDGVSSEDDVPLAQRIPTALQAQRTIRKQFRDERDRRRQQRAAKEKAEQAKAHKSPTSDNVTHFSTLSSPQEAFLQASKLVQPRRPSTAGSTMPPTKAHKSPTSDNNVIDFLALSGPQEANFQASKLVQPRRPSTADSTSQSTRPFAPEELARKLQNVQVAESSRATHFCSPSTSARVAPRDEATRGRSTRTVDIPPPIPPHHQPGQNVGRGTSAFEAGSRTLRAMRSFHHIQRKSDDAQHGFSLTDAAFNFARRATTSRARSRVREEPPLPPPSAWQHPPLPGSQSPPVPPLPQPRQSGDAPRKLSKGQATPSKISGELERLPMSPLLGPTSNIKTQQRIFVGDLQKFHTVEIDNYTSALDVIAIVKNQGSLSDMSSHGDWMLFEVAQDFGMERPVRSYELLSDIQASWNKDKLVNMFIIKMTPLATLLSRDAIPSSSPTHGSYVEWEIKRGKWTKRWLRLREHSLWLSKRDNGKDEVFLCSLSNFDAYFVTRAYKSPKPFVFAIKSTDNLSFFENKADYMHIFSCQAHDGQKWIEKILIARSYVLYQERNVLFNPKAAGGNGSSLSRAGTRKIRPSQPFVNIPAGYPGSAQLPSSTHPDVFEPGSLLAKN